MTVALALKAADGVVLVADGQPMSSQPGLTTAQSVAPLGDLHERIAYALLGSAGVRQRVAQSLNANISPEECGDDFASLRPRLHKAVNEVQQQAHAEHLRTFVSQPGEVAALFAGVSDRGEPWIYEIQPEGSDEEHEIGEALGSGRPFVIYSLMSAGYDDLTTRPLGHVGLLAYRVIDEAIRGASRDLSGPISMYVVSQRGAVALSEAELLAVRNDMISWQQLERELGGRVR